MPDYDAHIEHLRRSHPERPVPTEREYYAEYLRQPLRRWTDPVLLVARDSLPRGPAAPLCGRTDTWTSLSGTDRPY